MLSGMKVNEQLKKEYYAQGYWTSLKIYDHFKKTVEAFPKRIAVVDQYVSWTYEEVYRKVLKTAKALNQLGVKRGDCIAVQLPNWSEYVVLYLAINKVGAILNPIPITARAEDVIYMLNACESKVYFITSSFRNFNFINMMKQIENKVAVSHIIIVEKEKQNKMDHNYLSFETFINTFIDETSKNEQTQLHADDPAVILFTSGTESLPKGVIHSDNTVLYSEKVLISTLEITENDAVIMASPLSHSTGFLRGMTLPLLVGAKSVLLERFTPEVFLRLIEQEKCTFSMGASVFLHDLLDGLARKDDYDISSFRFFLCGGSPIPKHIVKEADKKGFKVLSVYGSTESSPHIVNRITDSIEKISITDGKPVEGIEVKVVDEERNQLPTGFDGEEASRGPNVFLGYLNDREMTDRYLDDKGWYYSGDLCKLYEDGYVQVVGRKKEMIIRGGQNISPSEIEDILYKHPKLEKVAVIGIPDKRLGEKTCAFVVPKNRNPFSFSEMISFLEKQNIAKYKYPEKLEVLDELPSTASGKIQKNILQERYITL